MIAGAGPQPAPRPRRARFGRRQAELPLAHARHRRDRRRLRKTASSARWATARCPRRALTLAREALLHDPYHDEWMASPHWHTAGRRPQCTADAPFEGRVGVALRPRRQPMATAALNPAAGAVGFGRTRAACARRAPRHAGATGAGVRRAAQVLASQWRRRRPRRRRHHLGAALGADAGRMGSGDRGLDPPALQAWQLGAVDLDGTPPPSLPPPRCAAARSSPAARRRRCTMRSPTGSPPKTRSTKDHARSGRRGAGRRLTARSTAR